MPLRLLIALACALAFASPASAAPRPLLVGATEDAAKSVDPVTAKAKMDLARLAGFDAIRLSSVWRRGLGAPDADELLALRNAAFGAELNGIRVIVSVWQFSGSTPLTQQA